MTLLPDDAVVLEIVSNDQGVPPPVAGCFLRGLDGKLPYVRVSKDWTRAKVFANVAEAEEFVATVAPAQLPNQPCVEQPLLLWRYQAWLVRDLLNDITKGMTLQ